MKFRIPLFLLTLALAASSTLSAHAIGCTNATIKGAYAFTIHGQIFLPNGAGILLVDGLARTTFDGAGGISQLDAVAANGNVAPGWRLSTGGYAVNSNCTGTFNVTNGDQSPIHVQFIIAHFGNHIHAVVIDPGFATTSEGERLQTPKE